MTLNAPMPRAATATPARRSRGGFTIIELLVVIAILATIIGILLPALGGARAASRKTEELNNIRPMFAAWNLYAGQNDDAALPGWIAPAAQDSWEVSYRYPDQTTIPAELAAPYSWRLMKFLDYNTDTIIGRLDSAAPDLSDIAEDIAFRPQFGYNGLYIGGFYEPPDTIAPAGPGGPAAAPVLRFGRDRVVAQKVSQVGGTPRTVVFCASASTNPDDGPLALEPGLHKNFSDSMPGSHLVVPPVVAGVQVWASGGGGPSSGAGPLASAAGGGSSASQTAQLAQAPAGGSVSQQGDVSPTSILIFDNDLDPRPGVPLPRYTKTVAVAWSDGSTSAESPGGLCDWRKWIPRFATTTDGGSYGSPGGYPEHGGD